jgi:hypothetical protein
MEIPRGLCQCGCGKKAPIAKRGRKERGQIKGQILDYCQGHGAVNSIKHGQSRRSGSTSEYGTYQAAKQRCTDPNDAAWDYYGGRGIKFLFTSFSQFFSLLGKRPKGMSLDRIDNNGNYEPGNVRWATEEQQRKNKRRSGKGYYWNKINNRWQAYIFIEGELLYLGVFVAEEDAAQARANAMKKFGKERLQ